MDPLRAYAIRFGQDCPPAKVKRVVDLTSEAMAALDARAMEEQDRAGDMPDWLVSFSAEINTAVMGYDLRLKRQGAPQVASADDF